MIFRALTVFSQNNETLSTSPTLHSQSFRGARANMVTPPPPEYAEVISEDFHELCHCRIQQDDYCPYCDIRDPIPNSTVTLNELDRGIPSSVDTDMVYMTESRTQLPVRRRKLQKTKSNYQKLQHKPSIFQFSLSGRPESVLSANSRTPLLNPSLATVTDYPEPRTTRRNPNKLAKRTKTRSSMPTADFSQVPSNPPSDSGRINSQELSRTSTRASNHETSEQISQNLGSAVPRLPLNKKSSNIGTNDLVSLAWTGEVQPTEPRSESSGHLSQNTALTNLSEVTSANDHSLPWDWAKSTRPKVLRKPKSVDADKAPLPLAWSLAMAITDDKITDEKLVDQLEGMRIKEHPHWSQSFTLSLSCPSQRYRAILNSSYAEYPPEPDEFSADEPSETSWNAARQALLFCREMLRTERRYLSSLRILAKRGTATPPPPSMLYYLPKMLLASDGFLKAMTQNPSVQGVSEAFLANQAHLDEAFVSWCSVVGSFFCNDVNIAGPNNVVEDEFEHSFAPGRLRRCASTPDSPSANNTVITLEPNKIRRNSKGRPSVRDLAILPTQRISRYVQLFKGKYSFFFNVCLVLNNMSSELHALTPPNLSSSFVVGQALRAAEGIAHKCDDAQGQFKFHLPAQ